MSKKPQKPEFPPNTYGVESGGGKLSYLWFVILIIGILYVLTRAKHGL